MLEARDIHKYYLDGKARVEVLKGVSLSISQQQSIAILGPSGAGKSTLLNILGGLDKPTQGQVLFDNRPLNSLSEGQLALARNQTIGLVFQFYHLLPEFNLLENVMMPALIGLESRVADPGSRERAKELLKEVGLSHRLKHLPSQLSGGEQQRAAIARALINEPKLLLCDEPTGNLDSENGRQIIRMLKDLNRKKAMAIVMVTHNLELADFADRVYHIRDGKLELK